MTSSSGENALGHGHFTHLTMVALNDIRFVYNTAYVWRIGEVQALSLPFVMPWLYDDRVLLSPLLFKVMNGNLRPILCGYQRQAWDLRETPLGSYNQRTSRKCESGAQLTTGHLSWKYVLDGIREAYETINASNQDVFHTAALKVGKNAQPKFSSLLWDAYIPIKSLCPYWLCQ